MPHLVANVRFVGLGVGAIIEERWGDKKPGPMGKGLCAEGFFCLDLLLLFYQEKRRSLRGDERTNIR
jgi:hypothetical protein